MEMEELVSNMENPGVLILINTAKILSTNIMGKANDALKAIGDQSDWADVIEAPGQSAPEMQGGAGSATLTIAATSAIVAMACIGDRKVIRHLVYLIKAGMPNRFFLSRHPTELANQNYLPILTDMLKHKHYIEDAERAVARIRYVTSPLREALMTHYSTAKTRKVATASVRVGGAKDRGVYEHKKR